MRMTTLARNADFTRLWVGQALSKLGQRGTALALPLLILHVTGSPAIAGIAAFVDQAVDLLVTLPGGAVADRFDRRTVMVVCDLLGFAALAGLALAVTTGAAAALPIILVASLLDSVATSVYGSASAAALPSVVGEDDLPDAISLVQARNSALYLVGPILGGLLFAVNPALPFVLDAASYLVSAYLALRIRTPLGVEVDPERTFRADLVAGLKFLAAAPPLRLALVNACVLNSVFGGVVLAVIAVSTVGGASSSIVGVVVAHVLGRLDRRGAARTGHQPPVADAPDPAGAAHGHRGCGSRDGATPGSRTSRPAARAVRAARPGPQHGVLHRHHDPDPC